MTFTAFTYRNLLRSAAIAVGAFTLLGTVSALWENPLFMRMTPTSGFELTLLAIQSVAFGLYLGIPRPSCAARTATAGGVLGFLGIACPVCNKLLLMGFGSSLLLTYFEPIRIYVAAAGALLILLALWLKLRKNEPQLMEAQIEAERQKASTS
jgi:hypothetical protein